MNQLQAVSTASITLMSVIAGLIFATAEGAPLAGLCLPIGVASWFLVDRDRRIVMPGWMVSAAGLIAILAALSELLSGNIEARLLSGGHLLAYLSWVFLLQPKTPRVVWWLAALSILQMAVSSVLTSAAWFGIVLLGWSLVAIWTMAVFTMECAVARTRRSPTVATETGDDEAAGEPEPENYSLDGLRLDESFQLLSSRFVLGVATISAMGLFVSLLFFVLIPRVWMSPLRFFDDSALRALRSTGFADQVRLGDIGEIMGSTDVAMRMTFQSHPSGAAWMAQRSVDWLGESPLFRGRTLENYRNGRWESVGTRTSPVSGNPPRRPALRVDVELRALGTQSLFTVGRTITCLSPDRSRNIEHRALTDEYFRSDEDADSSFNYQLFVDPESPVPSPSAGWDWRLLTRSGPGLWDYEPGLIHVPESIPSVVALSKEALANVPSDAPTHVRARRLESFLRDNPSFTYSLHQTIGDRSVDPLEDFLVNRRSGHCEYYASALALMLRAARIPSRLVTGYKGGYWDENSEKFVVEQRHAHAWVEARVDEGWITLDATPAERDIGLNQSSDGGKSLWTRFREVGTSLWGMGISMTGPQQRTAIYQPLAEAATATWESVRDFRGTAAYIMSLLRNPERWFSWQGGATVFTLLLTLTFLIRGLMRMISRIRSWRGTSSAVDATRFQVPFYDRFRAIVAEHGLTPEFHQTAVEFSEVVNQSLETPLRDAEMESIPGKVADEFYRVRFGGRTLTELEQSRLTKNLDQLEDCLSSRDGINSRKP